ncbi:MAG TPA: GMC family oxidoreductase [Acidobacteriaceae bacterium]|jgi:choline dehydrogenase-like flavoprotein|nr:GMC family oxidoreductase [Acidobacteriaceae bacterium]
MSVRLFYLTNTYGPLQEKLTGVQLKLRAPPEWIASHVPHLPPSRLRYDSNLHEVLSTEGPLDYLVVGSGPAGSVLAHELRRGGKRVLLVERGSFTVPGALQTRMLGELLDSRFTDDGGILLHNGETVGGGSEVNVDLCFAPTLPAVSERVESWRRDGRIGEGDFTQAQLAKAYEWVKASIGTRALSQSEINNNNRVLWEGALGAGLHPKLYDLNTYPPGRSPYPVTDKRSSESQLLLDALEDATNPLSILPDAEVRRVLFEQHGGDEKAVGVELRARRPLVEQGVLEDPNQLHLAIDETFTIRARTVILSAGALGSPSILLRSGVPNDQIGRGVVLHPSMPLIGHFDRPIDALDGTQASVYVDDHLLDRGYAFESMSADPQYAAVMSFGSALHTLDVVRSFRQLAGFGVMLIDTPSSANRLVLDERGEPRIEYRLSEDDKRRFRDGLSEAVRVLFLAGADRVSLPTTENWIASQPDGQSDVFTTPNQAAEAAMHLQFVPNRSILTSAHMQGTDKMGLSPSNSVVGTDFHVWGTQALYVVDGSVFPTSVGANPMQTIYTFAKIFADKRQVR